jgi:ApaG protein
MNQAYEAETRGVVVRVRPEYLADQSEPEARRWVWAYHVEVENRTPAPVQLLARRWLIIDAAGRTEEVKGLGVVGEQPVVNPGQTFRYTSGCPLATPSGVMRGSYRMAAETVGQFDAEIPAFSLDLPDSRRTMN